MKSGTKVHFSSARSNWATPQAFFDELDKEFNIAWDVCAEHHTAKCPGYWTKDDDGLSRTWEGVCYMNPPYGREITKWVKKAYEEFDVCPAGDENVVYCFGALHGQWPDGSIFGDIRFIDRFVVRDGLLTNQKVWNDLAEVANR